MADPRVSNPAYDDPYLAGIASNIGKMFSVGNMGRTIVQRAQAQHYQLQNDKLAMEAAKRSSIAGSFRNSNGAPLTPQQIDAMTGDAVEGGMKPSDIAGMTLYRQSNTGQPVSAVGRAFVGAGHAIGKDQGLSVEDREAVAARENNEAARRSSISAGPGYAAVAESRRYHDNELAFKDKTRWDAPIHVAPGSGLILNPGDARTPSDMIAGEVAVPVPAKPSADKFVQSYDPETKQTTWRQATEGIPGPPPHADRFVPSTDSDGNTTYQPVSPGLPAKADHIGADKTVVVEGPDGKPVYAKASEAVKNGAVATTARPPATKAATSDEAKRILYNALESIGAVRPNDKGTMEMDPDFVSQFGGNFPAAEEAAMEALKTSKNVGTAQQEILRALKIPEGHTFKPRGTPIIGSGPAALVPRQGTVAAPPAAPAAVKDPLEGRTATGPNGQKVMRSGGQWVPVQ